jgi:lauroyl/myristoyl acyltransferase
MDRWGRLKRRALPTAIRLLRRFPYPVAEAVLIGLSLGQALANPARLRRAHAWAAAGGAGPTAAWTVALGLFVHRGRSLAASPLAAILDPEDCRRRFRFEGLEHLEDARRRGGVLLLGFHVGMLRLERSLLLLGHRVTTLGESDGVDWPAPAASWHALGDPPSMHVWRRGIPGSRADALYRLREAAQAGEIVMLMGDSGQGRVVFEIALPGRPVAVRAGWFALRRLTRLPTLPVVGHREGGTWVVTIHPALPEPYPDEQQDREACRVMLAGILQDFVARFPGQCLHLAMRSDE